MLIFVLQTIWLYIAELAGKDLDIGIIWKFLIYITPTLIPLILPLTILLASIMVFGNFAENYEFAAMKSTGISLQRAMRSLSVFIVLLGVTIFFFSNNVIPSAQLKSHNLRKNIAKLKPAMAIAEGQFNQIGTMNIKVDKKSGDRGQYLKGVVIHKLNSTRPGNYTTILSKTGELISSMDSDVLRLVLYDGNYYDEILSKNVKDRRKKPFVKSEFKEYIINFDLGEINGSVDLEQKQVTSKYDMLSVGNLNYTIDSLKIKEINNLKEFSKNTYERATISGFKKDSVPSKIESDSLIDYLDLFDTKQKIQIVDMSLNKVLSTNQIIQSKDKELGGQLKWLNKHIIAYHEKFALGFACIILFFVGAPLGALIKKGGIGLPMVIAIVLFLIYHFIGIFAKNSAEDGSLNPILSAWLSTLIMLPIGIYLTTRATKDRGLFELDFIMEPVKRLFKFSKKELEKTIELTGEGHEILRAYSNDQLINIVKNYKQLNYSKDYKKASIEILDDRGISKKTLKLSGNLKNVAYKKGVKEYELYKQYSRISLSLYVIGLIPLLLYFVFKNNKLSSLAEVSLTISTVSFALYLVSFVLTHVQLKAFYKTIQKGKTNTFFVTSILGIPFYFLIYFFFNKKTKEDLKLVR